MYDRIILGTELMHMHDEHILQMLERTKEKVLYGAIMHNNKDGVWYKYYETHNGEVYLSVIGEE